MLLACTCTISSSDVRQSTASLLRKNSFTSSLTLSNSEVSEETSQPLSFAWVVVSFTQSLQMWASGLRFLGTEMTRLPVCPKWAQRPVSVYEHLGWVFWEQRWRSSQHALNELRGWWCRGEITHNLERWQTSIRDPAMPLPNACLWIYPSSTKTYDQG